MLRDRLVPCGFAVAGVLAIANCGGDDTSETPSGTAGSGASSSSSSSASSSSSSSVSSSSSSSTSGTGGNTGGVGGVGGTGVGGAGGVGGSGGSGGGAGGSGGATGGGGTGGAPLDPAALVWAKRAGGTTIDRASGIGALADGSSLVAGVFSGTAKFGPAEGNETTLFSSSASDTDLFLARYEPAGTLLWAKRAGGTGAESAGGVAVLADGTSIVTGYFNGDSTFGAGEANQTLLTSPDGDVFVAKFDPSGSLAWAKKAGGPSFDGGDAISGFADGSSVVGGFFQDSGTFGAGEPNQTILAGSGVTLFLARYDSAGALAWAKKLGGVGTYGVGAIPDGSAIVTGAFQGSATFGMGDPNQTTLTGAGAYDLFIARYDSAGSLLWAKRAGGPNDDGSILGAGAGGGISTLADGTSFVTGRFSGSATFGPGEAAQTILTSAGAEDAFIAKYDPSGALVWAKSAGGTMSDGARGIGALADGSALVSGHFNGTIILGAGEAGETSLTSAGSGDIFVARFDPAGLLVWAKRAGGATQESESELAALADGSALVVGGFTGSTTFGPGEPNETVLTSAGMADAFIAKYGLGQGG